MKSSIIFASLASLALAAPAPKDSYHRFLKRAAEVNDTVVLNFALTLEHLENAFYSQALSKFDDNAFTSAGLPSWVRGRFVQIGQHEAAHVAFLSTSLGSAATQPCEYSFPYTDPKSFAALSNTIEGVGVSAYTGAAQLISDKTYLTAAASVLSTEARHTAWTGSAVLKSNPWSGPEDIPLPLNAVYTIAAQFITKCPDSNPALPVKAFPALNITGAKPGQTVPVSYQGSNSSGQYVAFYSGLAQYVVPIQDGKVAIPGNLTGTSYAVVTTNSTASSDADTIAGPAILQFPFDAAGNLSA